jgi:ABC-type nickel/cobalt efflux system permease component RcnA
MMGTAAANDAFHVGLVLTAFGFGFRHGIDWDHIAALTDITSSQDNSRRSMYFATLYAFGHGLVVFALGSAAIVFSQQLPRGMDRVMERFVGATLVVLAVYVVLALVRHGRDFRMRSRWMLLFAGLRRTVRAVRPSSHSNDVVEIVHEHAHAHDEVRHHAHDHDHELVAAGTISAAPLLGKPHRHAHRHVVQMPDDPFGTYAGKTAFGVGMIHGIGAETPTQVLLFVTAAGAGGKVAGMLLLGCFLIGLLSSNTVVALAGTFGFLGASRNFAVYVGVSLVTAAFSLAIGSILLFGTANALPALLGG